jgi:hypothetical protein
LATHKRQKHQLCEFCDVRYFDADALHEHLLKNHQRCEICRQRGQSSVFFPDYARLAAHLHHEHILCKLCADAEGRLFRAFATDIDFKVRVAVLFFYTYVFPRYEVQTLALETVAHGLRPRRLAKRGQTGD